VNRKIVSIFLMLALLIGVTSCMPQYMQEIYCNKYKPINIIPMYGEPYLEKTDSQKEADARFIETAVKEAGSREKASEEFSAWGWREMQKGNIDNATRRFNQAWLLDDKYYQPYWGFALIEGRFAVWDGTKCTETSPLKSLANFETALSLITDDTEKPQLLVSAAEGYFIHGAALMDIGSSNDKTFLKRSNSLIDEALQINPKYAEAYKLGAYYAYEQKDYKRAWNIVSRSREIGAYKFEPGFIDKLSKEMDQP
jgi:hypothetical protein